MDRFAEDEMIRLLAYQNLYGPIGPQRMDTVAARLGMDIAAPHMKKGKKPKFKDHLIEWSRKARPQRSGRELLAAVRGIQAGFEKKSTRGGGGR
ncbi:phage tail assembly protein T [Streptomyces parvus]|uniref:phage tail assembly protein T n=1 Tax=Streptomyces parvus TaxID=66428 RepID=UPI0033297553